MYKLARPDGFDFYTGKTINYRENIGKIVRVKDFDLAEKGACGKGLHASRNLNDCFIGAGIPCSAFKVKGIQKITWDEEKSRYQALKVLEEIEDLDELFGWNYYEAINPVNPFKIKPPKITDEHIKLLEEWISINNSIRYSIRYSIGYSIWDSIGNFIGVSVMHSIWDSIECSIWDFIGDSTIQDPLNAYMGSLFPNIKKWKYVDHKKGVYPFQCGADLWRMGLVPSFDGQTWKLLGGPRGEVLLEKEI